MAAGALHTDLYQLTMIAGYVEAGLHDRPATFELFIRRLPPHRAFVVAAGLDTALDYIQDLRFTPEDVAWLRTLPVFASAPPAFFDYLERFRFTGDVWAMPEGTPFFPYEPVLRVSAPLAQAQLLETALLAIVNFQTSVASKAARLVLAAAGRPVMEFGGRRAQGTEAAVYAARAAFAGGCDGTSFVEAGRRFGLPLSGTMAHSWVLAFDSELDAFTEYARLFGDRTVLLLDTFDTVAAARAVVASGLRPSGVRLDSGDFLALSREVRDILDAGGLRGTRIMVSGDLNEYRIRDLVAAGAPIDVYAVGTALVTSEDAPSLGGVYKLVQVQGTAVSRDVMKRSVGKATWPGRKQVYRLTGSGEMSHDVVALEGESAEGEPLLEPVMIGGRRVRPAEALTDIRARALRLVARLPERLRSPDAEPSYEVRTSDQLREKIDG